LLDLEQTVSGLSPLVLTGLALSGANLPPDDLGRHAGILTAEEILSLDLSRCYLVTLSACDTSLGVRRAGQGYASLRAALQGAGARYVLTSLWKVGDEATMELMVDFYRRLWVQKKAPHVALWEAKVEARRKGAPFRDWAGWVLTGR
jgi:CHAT domain-containing protein